MKAFLMYREHDFDMQQSLPLNHTTLIQDLELNTLLNAMSSNDEFIFDVAMKALMIGNDNQDAILYRQNIIKDCLKNPSVIRDIYALSIEAIEGESNEHYGIFREYPDTILHRSVKVMKIFADTLQQLKNIVCEHSVEFSSEGFTRFFDMIKRELDDEYFANMKNHLDELEFHNGILISAELGSGNKGVNTMLRKQLYINQGWIKRMFTKKAPAYTLTISERDEAGYRALSELKNRGLNLAANALAQSTEHILSFFKMLRVELAFYLGCMNLYNRLVQVGQPVSFPVPTALNERNFSFKGLYDVCLTLTKNQKVVCNDINADGKDLMIITGANQGGKSTFLRSIGISQLMMQCGMFVPAEFFCANICSGLYTHFKREEDTAMKSGKLDEELSRMSDIVEHIKSNSIILFNESFAATNEREGSEIARQIVSALLDKNIKIVFVTHFYEFSHRMYEKKMKNAVFLRAERQADGKRTYKMIEGEPLQTSYGEDLYDRIFNINR